MKEALVQMSGSIIFHKVLLCASGSKMHKFKEPQLLSFSVNDGKILGKILGNSKAIKLKTW